MLILLFAITTGIIGADLDYSIHNDIGTLNDEFRANALSHEFEKGSWGWSWSASMIQNNVLIGVANISGDQHQEDRGLSLDLSFRARMYEVGYFFGPPYLMACLKIGGGYSHANITITSQSDSVTFSGILDNPGGTAYLTGSCLSVSGGVGILVPLTDYIGVRLTGGYIHGFEKPDWEFVEGGQVYGGPELDLSQIYIKAGIVMGEFRR